jgi:hypothetical protein
MVKRHKLTFASLDDVLPDVERLLAGHVTVGRWSLGQICNHLTRVFDVLVDGVPNYVPPSRLVRPLNWCLRKWFFGTSGFPTGVKAPSRIVIPEQGLDTRHESEKLRVALGRFLAAQGPFPAHPYLGPLTKAEWEEFNRRHCAHHLGFAVPQ